MLAIVETIAFFPSTLLDLSHDLGVEALLE
jgi:hypothetical protein